MPEIKPEIPMVQKPVVNAGESAGVRPFLTKRPKDVKRLHDLDAAGLDTSVATGGTSEDGLMDRETILGWMKGTEDDILRAVVGKSDHPVKGEVDRPQGFVNVLKNDANNTPRIRDFNPALLPDNVLPLEILWQKLPGASEHQMSSGVRTVTEQFFRATTQLHESTATLPDGRHIVTEVTPSSQIAFFAYIKPDNVESQQLAAACGFEKTGLRMDYLATMDDGATENLGEHDVYRLTYEAAQAALHRKGDDHFTSLRTPREQLQTMAGQSPAKTQ
jgi:hypothetical protein